MNVRNAQLAKEKKESIIAQSFSEDIGKLVHTRNIARHERALAEMIIDKVAINLDMFSPFMKNGIGCNLKGSLIITENGHGLGMNNAKCAK